MSGGGSNGYDPAKTGGQFGKKLTGYLNSPAPVFDKSLYTGMGETTQNALAGIEGGANPAGYSGFVGGAIGDFGDVAAGNRFGTNDPGFATLRQGVIDDTMSSINSTFGNSGMFGSDSNLEAAGRGIGSAIAGLDYGNFQNDIARQQNAVGTLNSLYGMSQQPGQTQLAAGQIRDADALAGRQGEADLFERDNNADYNRFLELIGAFTGSQSNAGMKQEVPWWQSLLGGIGQIL